MKALKNIALVLLGLVLLVCIISLFFPTAIDVERSIVVDASPEAAFENVNAMENWKKWGGPWHEEGMDYLQVIQRTEGATSGVGSILVYDQGDGEGTVQIIESESNQRIKTLITFAVGGNANGNWTFVPEGNGTKVTWGIHVELGYNPLMRIMGNLMMADKVGPLFDTGLGNLKKASE